jgi:two-component system sensor histidine kinase RegB
LQPYIIFTPEHEVDQLTRQDDVTFPIVRSEWLPLRTVVLLRWVAIAGQLLAILVAKTYFSFDLPLLACLLVVGLAIGANLLLGAIYPAAKRLSERESLASLLFDAIQLATMIYLTGGLTNPFALLMLAPVIVSSSALNLRNTLFLGGVVAVLTTLLFWFFIPLVRFDGSVFVTPLLFKFGFGISILIGIAFLGFYARKVSNDLKTMSDALLATQMALSRAQKLTDLGGVVAAAAHELGTPLATIKLISSEVLRDLPQSSPIREDMETIRAEANKCRDILRAMGKTGKDDLMIRAAPLNAILREAAQPHCARGKTVHFHFAAADEAEGEPHVVRSPEVIHGLRNLIQNAVDFARSNVWIEGRWSPLEIQVSIVDDGSGYPANLIDRIGDPYLRAKSSATSDRAEYEGMGLGLFIAKTLLERTGAVMTFSNASDPFVKASATPDRCGAIVEAVWSRKDLEANRSAVLGPNQLNAEI